MHNDLSQNIDFIKAALNEKGQAIAMIGLMGAGKSIVGQALAEALDIRFVDSDAVIEKNHGAISDIFKNHGEDKFRELERNVISTYVRGDARVLSTGGGAFMNDETRDLIQVNAISVWLDLSPEDTMKRFDEAAIAKRPLLANAPEGALAKLKALYTERAPRYGEAHVRVKVSDEGALSKEESIAQNRDRVINALYMHLNR